MKAIEFSRNGKKLFTAGLTDGMLDARLVIRNQEDPVWFDVVGRNRLTGGHARWAHESVELGDTFTMTLIDIDLSDVDDASDNATH